MVLPRRLVLFRPRAPLVTEKIHDYEKRFIEAIAKEDASALGLWKTNRTAAVEYLTAAAEQRGNNLVSEWLTFYQTLFMDFRDGRTPEGVPSGYGQEWYDRIAKETGDKYRVPDIADRDLNLRKMQVIDGMDAPSRSRGAHPTEQHVI